MKHKPSTQGIVEPHAKQDPDKEGHDMMLRQIRHVKGSAKNR